MNLLKIVREQLENVVDIRIKLSAFVDTRLHSHMDFSFFFSLLFFFLSVLREYVIVATTVAPNKERALLASTPIYKCHRLSYLYIFNK